MRRLRVQEGTLVHPPLLWIITNGTRTVRAIESAVRQRVHRARDSGEHRSSSTDEYIIALRADLCQILGVFDGNCSQLATAQLPQEGLEQGDILEASDDPPALALITVRRFVVIPPLFSADDLVGVGYVSIIHLWISGVARLTELRQKFKRTGFPSARAELSSR